MTDGLVSVITSIYNSGEFIAQAIESVQAQTYQNWEMVITDDCSTDNGPEIVAEYAARDPRIRLLSLPENGGPGVSRNNSIKNANGQYIAFLDSDDMWEPDKLESQIALMKKTGCGVVYSSYHICDEDGNRTGAVICKNRVRYWRIVCDNAIGFLTMMFDRKVTGDALLPTIRKRQDWGLNITLLKRCRTAYGVKRPLAYYRIRKGSVSRDKFGLIKYNVAIYRQVMGYSKIGSVLMFCCVFAPFYLGKKFLNVIKSF
ncbi:MAG: glycosyltransferase [Bacteroidaceae bacterium]|nr:glycosyltransferase [Bacteroidaceae bacterium]